jgi:hypothetical protein
MQRTLRESGLWECEHRTLSRGPCPLFAATMTSAPPRTSLWTDVIHFEPLLACVVLSIYGA